MKMVFFYFFALEIRSTNEALQMNAAVRHAFVYFIHSFGRPLCFFLSLSLSLAIYFIFYFLF